MSTVLKKSVRQEIGIKIREAREKKKLTQEEVAQKAKMKANYYAKIERGLIGTAPEKLYMIFKALGVEASDIFPN